MGASGSQVRGTAKPLANMKALKLCALSSGPERKKVRNVFQLGTVHGDGRDSIDVVKDKNSIQGFQE